MNQGQTQELLTKGSIINSRYEVMRTLGYGGMGTVVQVRDIALDGEIGALKILFPHLASDQTQFARFRNEVILARRLSHPHIVRIYDFGAWEKYFFLSMEYVEGGTLTDRIYGRGQGKLEFDEAIKILLQLGDGLSCAHKAGVVHRDMKPDNIMISVEGVTKIADFGLARALDIDKRFTNTGETVGTPYYMSPEQLAGEKPDQRVDIYSLGIMAYEMVIGRRPFSSDSYLELAHMHMSQRISDICQINPSTPKWFKEFVETCCEKKKEDRFSTSDEAVKFLLDHVEEKVKRKVYRVPAVLSIGAMPSVKRSKLSRVLKPVARTTVFLWILILSVHLLPISPEVYGKIRKSFTKIEFLYPFLTFVKEEDFQSLLAEKNWNKVRELLAFSSKIFEANRAEIVKAVASDKSSLEYISSAENKDMLLEIILQSNTYDVVSASVEGILKGKVFNLPKEKESLFVAKLMSFNEASLISSYFGPSQGGMSWVDADGESLIIYAYRAKAWNVIRVLLERGASADAKFKNGKSLLSTLKKEKPDIATLLEEYGAS